MMRALSILTLIVGLFSIATAQECEGEQVDGRYFLTCRTAQTTASASLTEIAPDRFRLDLGLSNSGGSPIEFAPATGVRYLARSPTAARPCTVRDVSPRVVAASADGSDVMTGYDATTIDQDDYVAMPIRFELEDSTCVLRYIRVDVGEDSYYFDPKVLGGATIEREDGP